MLIILEITTEQTGEFSVFRDVFDLKHLLHYRKFTVIFERIATDVISQKFNVGLMPGQRWLGQAREKFDGLLNIYRS